MPATTEYRLHEFDSKEDLDLAVRRAILKSAEQAIVARGAFCIALAGGDTPRGVYRALRDADADWSAWHVYFSDERCLPADDPDRNSAMARNTLLDHVPIPERRIHPIEGELGPDAAAANYARELASIGFDMVLLGLGEDGHTASLFPGMEWGEDEDAPLVLAVHGAPKMPRERVSLSAKCLGSARKVIFLVVGNAKRDALNKLVTGGPIPAGTIRPESGVDIYTDVHLSHTARKPST